MAGDGISLSVRVVANEYADLLDNFEREGFAADIAAALNSTIAAVRKRTRKEIESSVGLAPREAQKRLRASRARKEKLEAALILNAAEIKLRNSKSPTNPFRGARAGKRAVTYHGHVFPKQWEMNPGGVEGYFYRPAGRPEIASFPMLPKGEDALRKNLEGFGRDLFEKKLAERLARKFDRRGSGRSARFFQSIANDIEA